MKIYTDFALKEINKLFQSIRDKLVEINSLIDWKIFRIIFESICFNKKISRAIYEADVIITLKMLFNSNIIIFPTLKLINYVLIEFLSGNSLVFLSKF